MKFNLLSIMKVVSETLKHSKEYEAHYKEIFKEPVCGFNEEKSIRAFLDPGNSRFVKIQIKADAAQERDLVDILEEVTAAVNDALDQYDTLCEKMAPDSIKKLESEYSEKQDKA